MWNYSYSDNHKTLEQGDDFWTQVIALNSPMNIKHRNYAV